MINLNLMENWLIYALSIFLALGCGGQTNASSSGKSSSGEQPTDSFPNGDGSEKQPATAHKGDGAGEQPVESEISLGEVLVYMENSVSMKGYNMENSNGFTRVVSQLTYIHPESTKCYFYSSKLSPAYTGPVFSEMVSTKKVTYGESSPLNVICDTIIRKMNNQSLSFLVTDAIMSGSNENIRTNRNYNKDFRENLQMQITGIISKAKDKGVCIYQFKSNFKGTYYCFNNANVELKSVSRPFYVIAIGERSLLKDFHTKVIENKWEYFKPEKYLALGLDALPYKVSFIGEKSMYDEKDGYLKYQGRNLILDADGKKYIGFNASLNKLPAYMKTEEYVNANRLLFLAMGEQESKQIEPDKNVVLNYYADRQVLNFRMNIDRITARRTINIRIKNTLPDWCMDDSVEDDSGIDKNTLLQDKTFNLNYFIKGFYNGIYTDENATYIINATIKVTN